MREFAEFSKISIHQHFGSENFSFDRRIDDKFDKTLEFKWENAFDIIQEAIDLKFNMLATTNANVFDALKYRLLRHVGKKHSIEILPGIELNVLSDNKIAHLVIIFDPVSNLHNVQEKIKNAINQNQKNQIDLDQLVDVIIGRRVILIPHGIKQEERSLLNHSELINYFYDIRNAVPILIEYSQNYHKETLKNKVKTIIDDKKLEWVQNLAGVSGADRERLSDIASPTYIWGEPTFSDLYYAALMSDNEGENTRIKRIDDLIRKVGYIKEIRIKKSSKTLIEHNVIKCSHGLNAIIGPSGSGKTLLLNLINKKLTNNDLQNKSVKSNYDDIADIKDITLINEENEEIELNDISIFEGINLYNEIITTHRSSKPDLLKRFDISTDDLKFNELINTFGNEINLYVRNMKNINKEIEIVKKTINSIVATIEFLEKNQTTKGSRISYRITENFVELINRCNQKIDGFVEDSRNVNLYFNNVKNIAMKYLESDDIKELLEFKKKIIQSINKQKITEEKELFEIQVRKAKREKLFALINAHNNKMGNLAQAIHQKSQELVDYNNQLLLSLKKISFDKKKKQIPILDEDSVNSSIKLLPNEYARIVIKNVRLTINRDELKEIFSNHVSERETKDKLGLKNFNNIEYNLSNTEDMVALLKPFVESEETNALSLSLNSNNVVEYDLQLKVNDKDYLPIEVITAGMLSKIYIDKIFDDNLKGKNSKTIILYDQPDVNMEKQFILEELVSKLQHHKNTYQIFITTHEPLLVINADSNNIIAASNDKKVGESVNINYTNVNLGDNATKEKAYEKIAKLIDGSHKAVKLRSKIYGGMINED